MWPGACAAAALLLVAGWVAVASESPPFLPSVVLRRPQPVRSMASPIVGDHSSLLRTVLAVCCRPQLDAKLSGVLDLPPWIRALPRWPDRCRCSNSNSNSINPPKAAHTKRSRHRSRIHDRQQGQGYGESSSTAGLLYVQALRRVPVRIMGGRPSAPLLTRGCEAAHAFRVCPTIVHTASLLPDIMPA